MASSLRRDESPDAGESRAAVALTVAWMLNCLATAVGLAVVLVLRLVMLGFPRAEGTVHPLAQMSAVMLFVAVVTGAMCLALTPLAIQVRKTRPPRLVTAAAVVIGVLPIVVLVVLAVL